MKRYRVCRFDFDSRVNLLNDPNDTWEEKIKEQHSENKKRIEESLIKEFGGLHFEYKLKNFRDLGIKPISLIAYHNLFLSQIRNSFVMGSYYPALVGSCALAERILNHLILKLRDDFKSFIHNSRIYKKKSFSDWSNTATILNEWGILLPEVKEKFISFEQLRNESVHFNEITENDTRAKALLAIQEIQFIVDKQFSAFGQQPWYFIIPGECYVKKEFENHPFVKFCVIPNCLYVTPKHVVKSIVPFIIEDYEDAISGKDTDEEFTKRRKRIE